jgi:hypothetical protein
MSLGMKNITILVLVIFGITSCSKDSLDQNMDLLVKPVKSEIFINIASIQWADSGESGCNHSSSDHSSFIENAVVELYSGELDASDISGDPLINTKTDNAGTAVLKDLEPAMYTIYVETPLGTKTRTVTTQLHKRSYIDFSF